MTPQTALILLSSCIIAAFLFSLIFLIVYLRKHNKEMKAINRKPISLFKANAMSDDELNKITN